MRPSVFRFAGVDPDRDGKASIRGEHAAGDGISATLADRAPRALDDLNQLTRSPRNRRDRRTDEVAAMRK